jgi:hypothetical protein
VPDELVGLGPALGRRQPLTEVGVDVGRALGLGQTLDPLGVRQPQVGQRRVGDPGAREGRLIVSGAQRRAQALHLADLRLEGPDPLRRRGRVARGAQGSLSGLGRLRVLGLQALQVLGLGHVLGAHLVRGVVGLPVDLDRRHRVCSVLAVAARPRRGEGVSRGAGAA